MGLVSGMRSCVDVQTSFVLETFVAHRARMRLRIVTQPVSGVATVAVGFRFDVGDRSFCTNMSCNNNDTNTNDDVYGAVIATQSLREFTRFI